MFNIDNMFVKHFSAKTLLVFFVSVSISAIKFMTLRAVSYSLPLKSYSCPVFFKYFNHLKAGLSITRLWCKEWGRILALCLRQFSDWCGDLLRPVAVPPAQFGQFASAALRRPQCTLRHVHCGSRTAADANGKNVDCVTWIALETWRNASSGAKLAQTERFYATPFSCTVGICMMNFHLSHIHTSVFKW